MATKNKSTHDQYDPSRDVENIKSALVNAGQHLKDHAHDTFEQSIEDLKACGTDTKNTVQRYTERNPLKALGITLLVGVAVGFLLRR